MTGFVVQGHICDKSKPFKTEGKKEIQFLEFIQYTRKILFIVLQYL